MTAAAPSPMLNISQPTRLNRIFVIREDITTAYTFAQIDAGCQRDLNNAAAVAATIPPNSSVAFDIGTVLYGRQKGAGAVTVTAGAGVTFLPSGVLTTRVQGVYFAAVKVATDTWSVIGDFLKSNRTITVISSPTTAGAVSGTDYVYLVSGTTTLTLPTAVSNQNRYTVKNTDASATVSIASTSSQTFDGTASPITIIPGQSLDLISDNSNWWIV